MSEKTRELLIEIKHNRRNRLNKIVLGCFLVIAVGVLICKMVDGILIDCGFGVDKLMRDNYASHMNKGYKFIRDWSNPDNIHSFHWNFWNNPDVVYLAKATTHPLSSIPPGNAGNEWVIPALHAMVSRHPNTFWLLTQFTWITTLIIILFIIFRLFKYESTVPSWLKWIMSQRTLSLIAMYDFIVGVGFWVGMFNSFREAFIPSLYELEYFITVVVHGVIPLAILAYSLTYLIKDKKASILKETFVIKGVMYPFFYVAYYTLISIIWNDPYQVSNLRYDFVGNIWKLPVALLVLWIMLGCMLLVHNFILLRHNKHYDPRNDYEVIRSRDMKIEKIRKKTIRKLEKELGSEK